MAKRGIVTIEDGDGKKYQFKFGTNAIVKIQDELGKPLGAILEEFKDETKLDMRTIRALVQHSAKDPTLTPEEAGDLIDDVGIPALMTMFSGVFGAKDEATDSPLVPSS